MGNFDNYYRDNNGNVHRDIPLGTSPADAYVRTNMKLKKEVQRIDNAIQESTEHFDAEIRRIDEDIVNTADVAAKQLENAVNGINESIDEVSDSIDTRIASLTTAVNSRVDNIIAHNNDTEDNSELIDIRTGVDGTVFGTAGSAIREQISGILTNTGKWIYEFEGTARSFEIPVSVSNGDVIYFKPLDWDGDSFTSVGLFGNNNETYTALGGVTSLGDEKYITVNSSYSSLRVGFSTAQEPTSTRKASVKLVNLNSEGIASNVAHLNKQNAENSEHYTELSQQLTALECQTGSIIYSVTDTVRSVAIPVSASSGDTIYFKPLVWTGGTFTSIKLYGNNNGVLTELAKVTELNKSASVTLSNGYQSFSVGVSTAQIPYEDVTLTTVFSVVDHNSLSDLVGNTLHNIEKLEADISEIHTCDIECFCPTVYTVVGHEINIYYHNIMKCDKLDNYRITFFVDGASVSGNSIRAMEDGIRITPIASQVGTHTITLRIEQNEKVIKTFDFSLVVSAHSEKTIKAMFIGDSMTQQATYISEAKSLVGNSMTLYGTRSTTTRTFADATYDKVIAHEGRGGWTTTDYCSHQTGPGNVTNPFYNSGFDFSYYMSNHTDYSDLTDVFILLGTNDTQSAVTTVTANLQSMIDSIHAYNSNIKVHVGLPIPPCRDRFSSGSTSIWNHKNSMWKFCKAYTETLTGCTFVPYNVAVDCWYGFPRETVPVAAKLTETVERPVDFFHPLDGRFQMGDALYAEIMANS